jgi:hypothetical protein
MSRLGREGGGLGVWVIGTMGGREGKEGDKYKEEEMWG